MHFCSVSLLLFYSVFFIFSHISSTTFNIMMKKKTKNEKSPLTLHPKFIHFFASLLSHSFSLSWAFRFLFIQVLSFFSLGVINIYIFVVSLSREKQHFSAQLLSRIENLESRVRMRAFYSKVSIGKKCLYMGWGDESEWTTEE